MIFDPIKLITLIIIDIDKKGQNGTTIFNIFDNTTELWMTIILVTASGMPTALEIKPMPNADGIGQTALDGIENEIFRGF